MADWRARVKANVARQTQSRNSSVGVAVAEAPVIREYGDVAAASDTAGRERAASAQPLTQAATTPQQAGPAFDPDRALSCGQLCLCWTLLTLAFVGSPVSFVTAAVYTSRLILSARDANVAQYNADVSRWQGGGGAAAFARYGASSGYALSGSVSAWLGGQNVFMGSFGAPGMLNANPPIAPDAELAPYTETAVYYYPSVVLASEYSYTAGSAVEAELTLSILDSSTRSQISSASVKVPLFFYSAIASSTGASINVGPESVLPNLQWSCAEPYAFNNVSRKCEQWLQLRRICIVVAISENGPAAAPQLRIATDAATGAGCVPLPSAAGTYVNVPQLDACVASGLRNVGPFGYAFYGRPPPPPGVIKQPAVEVTLRSIGDPYVTALSLTNAATLADGSITFGPSTALYGTIAAAMWACFAACGSILCVYALMTWTRVVDGPMNRTYERPDGSLRPFVSLCGVVVGKSRRVCGVKAARALAGIVALLVFIAYSWVAWLLLDAQYVCAYQTLSCSGTTVQLQCGTLTDLSASSFPGATFRALNISAIAFLFIPIPLLFLCVAFVFFALTEKVNSDGDGVIIKWLFILWTGTIPTCALCSIVLQIIGNAYWSAQSGAIADAFCAYVAASTSALPTACSSVAATNGALVAQTVLGILVASAIAAGAAYVMRRRRSALSSGSQSVPVPLPVLLPMPRA